MPRSIREEHHMLTVRADDIRMAGTIRMRWVEPLVPYEPPTFG